MNDCFRCKNLILSDLGNRDSCRVGGLIRAERAPGFIAAIVFDKCGKAGRKFSPGEPSDPFAHHAIRN